MDKKKNVFSSGNFTDAELLSFLESNSYELSFKNLEILKEGLRTGAIELVESDSEKEEKKEAGEVLGDVRKDLQGEYDAINGYEKHACEAREAGLDDVADVLKDIGREEKVHVGEIQAILNKHDPDSESATEEGKKEASEELKESAEQQPVEEEAPEEGAEPRVSIEIPNDGSMSITTGTKTVFSDADNNVNVSLAESLKYLSTKNTERFLKSFLLEECKMRESEIVLLREEEKTESVKTIIISLLNDIQEKIALVDTMCADRSRGDIKQLRELSIIQDAITQLETLIDRDDSSLPVYSTAVNTIIKSILYINQYSGIFKDAYRNKKTLMIMKYQSLVLSIISAVTYLTSTILMYDSNGVHIKASTADIITFPPLVTLSNFIRSCDSGEFKIVSRDINIVREFYLEVPMDKMSTVLEAAEYTPMIVDGIKGILSNMGLDSNKLTNLMYKATGAVVLLLSIRDVFYTLASMKAKVPDMIGALQNFVNLNNSGNALGKISQFSKKFEIDAENSTEMAKREIEDQNKEIVSDIKSFKSNPITIDSSNISTPVPAPAASDNFNFDF